MVCTNSMSYAPSPWLCRSRSIINNTSRRIEIHSLLSWIQHVYACFLLRGPPLKSPLHPRYLLRSLRCPLPSSLPHSLLSFPNSYVPSTLRRPFMHCVIVAVKYTVGEWGVKYESMPYTLHQETCLVFVRVWHQLKVHRHDLRVSVHG